MTMFKIGDRVRCIKDSIDPNYFGRKGDLATVKYFSGESMTVKFDFDGGADRTPNVYSNRFELVQPKPPTIRIPREPVIEYDEVELKPGMVLKWKYTDARYIVGEDFTIYRISHKTDILPKDLLNEAGNWSIDA